MPGLLRIAPLICYEDVPAGIARDMTQGGAEALLTGSDGERDGVVAEILVSVPATSIAGGTDEIQRNIISERVLGMPREPR